MAGSSRILLVEDNADIIQLYARVLRQHYELQTATTVDEALAKVVDYRPDVILLDVMLPGGKSGLDALMLLRTNPAYGCVDVPIVMMTNLGLTGQLQQAWEEYADGYVIKAEILPTQLPEIVESFLKPQTSQPS